MFRRACLILTALFSCAVPPVEVNRAAIPEDLLFDECSVGQGPFFVEVSGIIGTYGGYVGYPVDRSAEADFGTRFLSAGRAWLEVVVIASFEQEVWGSFSFRVNETPVHDVPPWFGVPCGQDATCFEVGPLALRTGVASIQAEFYTACSDCAGYISDAKLWVEGVSTESPESLFGFAEFQTCFGLADLAPEDCCSMFDANADGKVDLLDIPLIY